MSAPEHRAPDAVDTCAPADLPSEVMLFDEDACPPHPAPASVTLAATLDRVITRLDLAAATADRGGAAARAIAADLRHDALQLRTVQALFPGAARDAVRYREMRAQLVQNVRVGADGTRTYRLQLEGEASDGSPLVLEPSHVDQWLDTALAAKRQRCGCTRCLDELAAGVRAVETAKAPSATPSLPMAGGAHVC